MAVDFRAPGRISHVGPAVLFKARGIAQSIFVDVKDGHFLGKVKTKCFPGNGEMPVAQPEKTPERKNGIRNAAVSCV